MTIEDAKGRCENHFDSEEAVAQCVAGERTAQQLVNVWDKIDGLTKEIE